MQLITKLTDESKQNFKMVALDGNLIDFYFYYSSTQECWNVDVAWNDFILRGSQLCNSPNLLRNYKNIIPFGLLCNSLDRFDPAYINDFISGRVSVFLLSQVEVEAIEAGYYS